MKPETGGRPVGNCCRLVGVLRQQGLGGFHAGGELGPVRRQLEERGLKLRCTRLGGQFGALERVHAIFPGISRHVVSRLLMIPLRETYPNPIIGKFVIPPRRPPICVRGVAKLWSKPTDAAEMRRLLAFPGEQQCQLVVHRLGAPWRYGTDCGAPFLFLIWRPEENWRTEEEVWPRC